jgi:hypothetical protein
VGVHVGVTENVKYTGIFWYESPKMRGLGKNVKVIGKSALKRFISGINVCNGLIWLGAGTFSKLFSEAVKRWQYLDYLIND